jgi:hypothetical protein
LNIVTVPEPLVTKPPFTWQGEGRLYRRIILGLHDVGLPEGIPSYSTCRTERATMVLHWQIVPADCTGG